MIKIGVCLRVEVDRKAKVEKGEEFIRKEEQMKRKKVDLRVRVGQKGKLREKLMVKKKKLKGMILLSIIN